MNEDKLSRNAVRQDTENHEAGPGEGWILCPPAPAVWRTAVNIGVSLHTWQSARQPSATCVIPGPMLQRSSSWGTFLFWQRQRHRGANHRHGSGPLPSQAGAHQVTKSKSRGRKYTRATVRLWQGVDIIPYYAAGM